MKANLIDSRLLVSGSGSSSKVMVKYQGHVSQKIVGVSGALLFHKHILFFFCIVSSRGPFVTAMGKCWCPDCFVCANPKCGMKLIDIGFVEEGGFLYCEKDYALYFAPHCAKCGEPIVGVSKFNPLPFGLTLGSSNSVAKKDMMSKILTNFPIE